MLRRDINQCMAKNTRALFPAVMCILAGIDLLAKIYEGSDKRGEVGSRFKKFVTDYLSPTSEAEVEAVWLLRNSLMHSFGLYSRYTDADGTIKAEYRFMLGNAASKTGEMVEKRGEGEYVASAPTLHERFERGLEQYRASLEANGKLQRNFRRMFKFYGTTGVVVGDHPMTHSKAEDQLLR